MHRASLLPCMHIITKNKNFIFPKMQSAYLRRSAYDSHVCNPISLYYISLHNRVNENMKILVHERGKPFFRNAKMFCEGSAKAQNCQS